jgi:hypothetical protein
MNLPGRRKRVLVAGGGGLALFLRGWSPIASVTRRPALEPANNNVQPVYALLTFYENEAEVGLGRCGRVPSRGRPLGPLGWYWIAGAHYRSQQMMGGGLVETPKKNTCDTLVATPPT